MHWMKKKMDWSIKYSQVGSVKQSCLYRCTSMGGVLQVPHFDSVFQCMKMAHYSIPHAQDVKNNKTE
jgi:hypothetical protein